MRPYYEHGGVTIYHGDALAVLPALPDNSIDLIATDPPYYRVKDEDWDRQWETPALFLSWLDRLLVEFARVLRPNGSLYLFASPHMAARVEVLIRGRFEVLNNIRWRKEQGRHKGACKEDLRGFFPASETIIFAEHFGADSAAKGEAGYEAKCDELRGFVFEPLRAYLDEERKRAGIDKADINAACGFSRSAGGMASRHYFSRSQWCLPTPEHYAAMQRLFGPGYLRREYEALRSEYEALRSEYEALRSEYEALRRPFAVSAKDQYTDVWNFPTVSAAPGKHECEKPLAMLEHIVRASSRPGGVVLDATAGSGTALEAARNLRRRAIGIETAEKWCAYSARRLSQEVLAPAPAGPQPQS